MGVKLDAEKGTINYGSFSDKLYHVSCDNVNFSNVNDISVPESVKVEFQYMITKRSKTFSSSKEALPFNTAVVAKTRTSDDKLVYFEIFPHPMGISEFVKREIADLLQSHYNNLTWVVEKK